MDEVTLMERERGVPTQHQLKRCAGARHATNAGVGSPVAQCYALAISTRMGEKGENGSVCREPGQEPWFPDDSVDADTAGGRPPASPHSIARLSCLMHVCVESFGGSRPSRWLDAEARIMEMGAGRL